jgi:hypothetical protein
MFTHPNADGVKQAIPPASAIVSCSQGYFRPNYIKYSGEVHPYPRNYLRIFPKSFPFPSFSSLKLITFAETYQKAQSFSAFCRFSFHLQKFFYEIRSFFTQYS